MDKSRNSAILRNQLAYLSVAFTVIDTEDGVKCSAKTSVDFQWTTLCCIIKSRTFADHRCENVKPCHVGLVQLTEM
jgi:hypothetical protein